MRNIYFRKWQSPVGDLFLYSSETQLLALFFDEDEKYFSEDQIIFKTSAVIDQAIIQLKEYFAGARTDFDLNIDFSGTDFQRKVWGALLEIPFGQTVTYAEQAKRIKSEKAVRAVGAANGKNPIAIIVPCHRVIGSNGKLTGYAGGMEMKSKLLALEAQQLSL